MPRSERDALLEAVQERLNRAVQLGDAAPVLDPQSLAQARRLAELIAADQSDLVPRLFLGLFHWQRYLGLPSRDRQDELRAAVGMLTPCFLNPGIDLELFPPELLPALADGANGAVDQFLAEALASDDVEPMRLAAALQERLVYATPAGHSRQVARRSNLGTALRGLFERTGEAGQLEQAVEAFRAALGATVPGHPQQSICAGNLGHALRSRFTLTGASSDLDESIYLTRMSLAAAPAGHPNRAGRIDNLRRALEMRFEITADPADHDEALRLAIMLLEGPGQEIPRWVEHQAGPAAPGGEDAG